jgi:Malectin domain
VSVSPPPHSYPTRYTQRRPAVSPSDDGAIRIAAGHAGTDYVDRWGRGWQSDHYYQGGIAKPGPPRFFPPVANEGLYNSIREAVSDSKMSPQSQRQFRYDIPVSPGVYELRLYFADPLRQSAVEGAEDAENDRHFDVELNGRPLLQYFDPIADGGSAAVDIRAFKDVHPAADGKIHLEFRSDWERAFVSALELTRGTPGKLEPIRIAARSSKFVDSDGTRWDADRYFIEGRALVYENPDSGPKVPELYSAERHGNFSYAIPVAPGSYTVRLHFLDSFFSPLIPAAYCHGVGCRIFDVTCNGVMLLQDFDIIRAASGAFLPVVREFHGLHPNGQGKLLLSFSPTVNYAEVRAIEVIDEAK